MRVIGVCLRPYRPGVNGDTLKLDQHGSVTAWKVTGQDNTAKTSTVVQVPVPLGSRAWTKEDEANHGSA